MLKKKKTLLQMAIATALTAGLTACGGGSSSSSDSSTNDGGDTGGDTTTSSGQELTGQFVDSPVGGLEYTRSDKGGEVFLTSDQGEFTYLEDRTVNFRIGQLTIGSAAGKAVLSPRDLASDAGATNIARVLQTLDDDGNPANGITISAQVRSNAARAATPVNIAETADLDSIEKDITDLVGDGRQLVSAEDAIAHLEETLTSIQGSEITSCSDEAAGELSASDLNGLTVGAIADDEILLFQFRSDGTFTEFNSGDNPSKGAVTWDGTWAWDTSAQRLALEFQNEYGELESDEFPLCDAGNRLIAEAEDGVGELYRLNKQVKDRRADGTYLLQYPDETGAVMTLIFGEVEYFEGESMPFSAEITYGEGMTTINWSGESDDELYFLAGMPTRTAIYLDFGEKSGDFQRIGVATATAPITNSLPTVDDMAGKTFLYRNDEDDEVVTIELKQDGTYTSFYNDSYENDVRQAAERREDSWTLTDGVLYLDEDGGTEERWRVALAKTTAYWGLKADENPDEINKIDSVSLAKPLTADSFPGRYSISIPTEKGPETLTISEGDSCEFSGSGCNWTIDENGRGVITFGSGQSERALVWQMAGRANGYIFVMTHDDDPSDVEPGYMTRN
ncbi:hypothetical protein [Marinobacter sp.]|uniref:hypothetical protein n=1 Tax=Marinobacter sp. TaxID=50741 RepID=UPI00356952E8